MIASTIIKLIFLLFFRSKIIFTSAQAPLSCSYCNDTNGNYTSSSVFSRNLKTLLTIVSTDARNNKKSNGYYYNASVGQLPDRVNAIAVCRADNSPKDCADCVNSATVTLSQACPVQKEAIGYYTAVCTLRYSNRQIFDLRENGPNCTIPQGPIRIPADDLGKVRKSLADLFAEMQRSASAGNSSYKFASSVVKVTQSYSIYGLAQCNPVLSSGDCSDCLGRVMNRLQQCCSTLNGINCNGLICSVAFANYPIVTSYTTDSSQPSLPGTGDSPTQSGKKGGNNSHKTWIIVVSVLSLMLVLVAIFGFLKRNMRKERKQDEALDDMKLVDSIELDFDNIQLATDNFSKSKRLDHGGSTAMYKGMLPDGQEILVKRLDNEGPQSEVEFDKEVLLSTNLQHKNLVKLLSFCVEKDLRILVYEFLPNGSLERFLNDPTKRASLDWQTRYQILIGLARGLLYLHEDSQVRVIHRDLKPSNVLLDAQMNPKISHFKTASLIQGNQTSGDTKVVGTYGYMPLEYVRDGQFSVKSDIFSYGVILLEIGTGYMINGFSIENTEESLLAYAWRKWRDDTTLDMVDDTLRDVETHVKEIKRCIKIGLLCVQEDSKHRPMMSTVVLMLNSDTVDVANPTTPSPLILNNMDLNSYSQSSTQSLKPHEKTSTNQVYFSYV